MSEIFINDVTYAAYANLWIFIIGNSIECTERKELARCVPQRSLGHSVGKVKTGFIELSLKLGTEPGIELTRAINGPIGYKQ